MQVSLHEIKTLKIVTNRFIKWLETVFENMKVSWGISHYLNVNDWLWLHLASFDLYSFRSKQRKTEKHNFMFWFIASDVLLISFIGCKIAEEGHIINLGILFYYCCFWRHQNSLIKIQSGPKILSGFWILSKNKSQYKIFIQLRNV